MVYEIMFDCQKYSYREMKKPDFNKIRLLSCPARARTWRLLIQSQTCCQLHYGANLLSKYTNHAGKFKFDSA